MTPHRFSLRRPTLTVYGPKQSTPVEKNGGLRSRKRAEGNASPLMMLDGLSPTQDPVLVPSLSKDPVGPWMEQALVHVCNEEFCDCMAGIENRRISASRRSD
ncbi:hypothetical protein NQZ68_016241 [Dissostichus eleginoides]|nr:hypothetical protein NQZ68_016241 [Dissostichus eleginoides]